MVSSRRSGRVGPARDKMHPNTPREPRAEKKYPDFRVPPSKAGPKRVFVCCHYCSYDPATVPTDGVCPKCGGHSWERFALHAKLVPDSLR